MPNYCQNHKTAARRRRGLVLTGHTMAAVAADLPPMGGGFSRNLIAKAESLVVGHDQGGVVYFTLMGTNGALLGEVAYHHDDEVLPGAYRAPRGQAAPSAAAPGHLQA